MGKVFEIPFEERIKLKNTNSLTVKLEIPEGYDEIKEFFLHYTALTELKISSSIVKICRNAFCECNRLRKVEFAKESQLEEIADEAFFRTRLTEIEIPSSVTRIGKATFAGISKLKQVKFAKESQLEDIDDNAFGHTSLTKIEIPSKVKRIGSFAFWHTGELQQVKFSEESELVRLGEHVFCESALTEICLPESVRFFSNKTFADSNLEKVMFGDVAIIEYDSNRKVRQLTIHTRNKELSSLLIGIIDSCENLIIKYNDYQELDKFLGQLDVKTICNNLNVIGKKLSTVEKWYIKNRLNKFIRKSKNEIVFEEGLPFVFKTSNVLSKENEELLGKIKSAVALFPKDFLVPLNNKLSSLLEEYNQKLNQAKPNINDYLNPTSALQVELSIEGDLEHWLFSKLLEIQSSLIHYDSIILGLKRLEDCRELLKLEIESKPKELTNVEDIIITIMYLVGKVDNNKKQEVLKDLESFFNETGTSYNTQLQLMHKLYESKENNILLPGEEYALPMVDLKIKLLKYMEELSKYVIKVAPYLSLLEALNSKEVLEYKRETNSISDTIIGIKYVISLIKNQVAKQSIEKEFSALCNEFIKKIEDTITRINEVKDNDYLNLEKELTQRLQPLLEKLDIYANQNDYMEQLINCRNMLKSNKKELNPKKAIESYIGETYDMILKLPLNEQELVKQKLLGVIEKWINNMPEEKEGLNLLHEIYDDITEISFSLKEYLGAIEDYSDKTRK